MMKTETGVSATPVSTPLRQEMPLTCEKAATPTTFVSRRPPTTARARPAPAVTLAHSRVEAAYTNSSTVSSSPSAPKLRCAWLKATRRWRATRPKVSVASSGDRLVV